MMDHLPYISAFGERFVSRCTLTFLVAAMLTSGLAGCLEASNQEEGLNLVVVYEATTAPCTKPMKAVSKLRFRM